MISAETIPRAPEMTSAILTLTAVLCLGGSAAQDDPAALLPPDTLIYVGTTSIRAGAEASRQTAMRKILTEAEVRAFLHQPTVAAEHVLRVLLQQGSEMFGEAPEGLPDLGKLDIDLDVAKAAAEPPFGRAFFALTHLTAPSSGDSGMPDVGLVLGVELLDDQHIAMLRGLWGQLPWPEETASHSGVEYLVRRAPEGFAVELAVLGRLAVVSTSDSALQAVIERHVSGDATALDDAAEYRAMLGAADGLAPGASSYFVRVAPLCLILQGAIPMFAAAEGLDAGEVGKITGLLEMIGLQSIRMVGGVSKVLGDGRIASTSVASIDPAGKGLVAKLAKPSGALEPSVLAQFPGNCLSAAAYHIGTVLVDVHDAVLGILAQVDPDSHAQVQAALAAFMGGASLRDDVLANLQGPVLSFSQQGEGLMGAPESILRMKLSDETRFVGAVKNLLSAIEQQTRMPVGLKESQHEGAGFYEIDLSSTPLGMTLQPAFAVRDGTMIASNSARRLKSFLNGDTGVGPDLSQDKGMGAFTAALAKRGGIQSLAFGRNAEQFGTLYGGVVAGAQVASAAMGDLPVDLSKLPPEDVISRHLTDTYGGAAVTKDGLHISQTLAQFRIADFLPLAVIAGLVAMGESQGIRPEAEAPEVDPLEQVENDLRELKASITVYKISNGDYPESLGDLLRPLPDFPEGAYTKGKLPIDAWGNAYLYAMEMHPQKNRLWPKIWSAGENGQDENGAGDDIVKF